MMRNHCLRQTNVLLLTSFPEILAGLELDMEPPETNSTKRCTTSKLELIHLLLPSWEDSGGPCIP